MLLHAFKMFWPIFKTFSVRFFVNFSSVVATATPSRTIMEQQIIFLQVHLWTMRNYAKSYRVLLL